MTKNKLCSLLKCAPPVGADFTITHVTEDSRRARSGSLFIAVRGEAQDGHAFAKQAVEAGAAAVAGNQSGLDSLEGVPYIFVSRPRAAAGLVAHALSDNPSRAMTTIGITGTNGKSRTACLVQAMLNQAGHRCANFGTIGYYIGDEEIPAAHTTPFGEDLADIFSQARKAGMSHVAMEASSHALEQDRVAGIEINVAAFTNLTQDHLDYHQDMAAYCNAKLKLFQTLPETGVSVVNTDDPAAQQFLDAAPGTTITYGKTGDCRASRVVTDLQQTTFSLESPWGSGEARIHLLGKHNVANALCAVAISGGLGLSFAEIVEGLSALPLVPGRFEPVSAGQDFHVIVDYAHTDDGLRNVLEAARKICKGKIITVFGCGGDRDKNKRPKMGMAAGTLSDYVILTSDNPRTEDPLRILLDAEVGLQRSGKAKDEGYRVIQDRAEAIHAALLHARPGDLVMIAGKGHEDYQILGTERIHFDDREIARTILEELLS